MPGSLWTTRACSSSSRTRSVTAVHSAVCPTWQRSTVSYRWSDAGDLLGRKHLPHGENRIVEAAGIRTGAAQDGGRKEAEGSRQGTQDGDACQHLHILTLSLGEPVKSFTYAFKDKNGKQTGPAKTYTPQEFYKETVGGPINGTFIMAMNDPRRPYYKTYEIEYDRHTYDGHNWKYVNLPMEEIARMAIASLKDSTKMYTSYDVGKQLDRKRGYLDVDNYDYATLFGTTFPMDKADRIATFDSGSTHAMTLTAVDLDGNGQPKKWKVENSWGAAYGQQGCLIMTNRWFNEYTFRLVVDNKYVPADILKAAQQKPVMVVPEDPLFQEDE